MRHFLPTLLAMAAPVLFAGCDGHSPLGSKRVGWGTRVVDWSQSAPGASKVPGIDSASVHFGVLGEGLGVTVWSDVGGSFGAGWDKTRQAVQYSGRFTAADQRPVLFECFTPDGKSGTAAIDGQHFNLENGALFLLSGAGAKTRVRQLKRPNLEPQIPALQKFATTDEELKGFFQTPAAPQ